MPAGESPPPGVARNPAFSTTHWTVVRAAAGAEGGAESAVAAFAELCRIYWYPIYCFLRRRGHGPADAQDLTQEFFSRLLGKGQLRGVDDGSGRFRSFLLVTLKHFLSDQRKRAQAQRRGGGEVPISLDDESCEARYQIEPADPAQPELLYERTWAHALLRRTLARLRARYEEAGNAALYRSLEPLLTGGEPALPYRQLGAELGLSEGALKVAAHRLRREFGRVLRDEVRRTVADTADLDAEIRHLFQVLSQAVA